MKNSTRETTVSVVTANFNHGSLIEKAIRSVALQSRKVLEHIIVDDASTDNSREIIRSLARKYPAVRILENECNMGPALSSGRAVHEARGDYIQFLSADDYLPPDSIADRLSVVDDPDNCALVCGDIGYVDRRTGQIERRRYIDVDRPVHISPKDLVVQQRRGLNVVNGGSMLARRKDILNSRIDDPELKWYCDTFALNAIAYRRGVWYVPGIQAHFTLGRGNYSQGSLDWHRQRVVLSRAFHLLSMQECSDVRSSFRDSAVLASFPFILRFLVGSPRYGEFLTSALVKKALAYSTYRKLRDFIPSAAVSAFVRHRTQIGHPNDESGNERCRASSKLE